MMRVGVQIVLSLVIAVIVGLFLMRGMDDAGEDLVGTSPAGMTPDAKLVPPPTSAPADVQPGGDAENEPAPSPNLTDSNTARPHARSLSTAAIQRNPSTFTTRRFNSRALEEAGYSPHDIDEIRRNWEEAKAEVRTARKSRGSDGIAVTPTSSRKEQREIDAEMREKLSDDDYDAGLYATGRDNRIEVHWVPEDGPATLAGIQEGDLLIEYDGTRVYTPEEYLDLWKNNPPPDGSDVILTIERAGGTFQLSTDRFYIGRLQGVQIAPR